MYATGTDIETIYGAEFLAVIALRDGDAAISDAATAAAIGRAAADAASLADTYLARRYPVPVSPTPAVLRNTCVDIACYMLASTHDRMTDIIRDRYEDCMRWLRDISMGKAELPAAADAGGGTAVQAAPEMGGFSSNPALFKRGGW